MQLNINAISARFVTILLHAILFPCLFPIFRELQICKL